MRHTRTLFTGSLIAAAVALALPLAAFAQDLKPAGIVTTLQGTATVRRVSTEQPAPQLLPLRFKDPVRLQDLMLRPKRVRNMRRRQASPAAQTWAPLPLCSAAGAA